MIKVGLTGGIGTGKTTVARVFKQLGIAVYNSDSESKNLIQTNQNLVREIKAAFGASLYDKNNILDRKKLSDIVFKDKQALKQLNALVHPAVIENFNLWCSKHSHDYYVIKESAILFESKTNKNLDKIITVTAPLEMRIERIVKRDKVSREKVLEIISNQLPDEEKIAQSDYVIYSDEKHSIIEQVLSIHKQILF